MELRIVNGEKKLIETVEQEIDPILVESQIAGAIAQAEDYEARAAECRSKAHEMQAKLDGNKTEVDEVKAEKLAKVEAGRLEEEPLIVR